MSEQESIIVPRGTNDDEYQIYLSCADDGSGIDITTGEPLKSYDDWLNS